jgi:hypothetical protein
VNDDERHRAGDRAGDGVDDQDDRHEHAGEAPKR